MPKDDDVPQVALCNCFAVRKAARQITRLYDAHLHPTGLRITQFLTLASLADAAAPIIQLADRLDIEQTAMGKMVATLVKDGLAVARRSPSDGRSRVVALTPKGRDLVTKATPLWLAAQAAFEARNGSAAIDALRSGFSVDLVELSST